MLPITMFCLKHTCTSTKELAIIDSFNFVEKKRHVWPNAIRLINSHDLHRQSQRYFLPDFQPCYIGQVVHMIELWGDHLHIIQHFLGESRHLRYSLIRRLVTERLAGTGMLSFKIDFSHFVSDGSPTPERSIKCFMFFVIGPAQCLQTHTRLPSACLIKGTPQMLLDLYPIKRNMTTRITPPALCSQILNHQFSIPLLKLCQFLITIVLLHRELLVDWRLRYALD